MLEGEQWTAADVTAIVGNPFYYCQIDPLLCQPYRPLQSEDEWVARNRELLAELGSEQWLGLFLRVMRGEAGQRHHLSDPPTQAQSTSALMNPVLAINIPPVFGLAHQPMFGAHEWVQMGTTMLAEQTPKTYLRNLLAVLKGTGMTGNGGFFGYQ